MRYLTISIVALLAIVVAGEASGSGASCVRWVTFNTPGSKYVESDLPHFALFEDSDFVMAILSETGVLHTPNRMPASSGKPSWFQLSRRFPGNVVAYEEDGRVPEGVSVNDIPNALRDFPLVGESAFIFRRGNTRPVAFMEWGLRYENSTGGAGEIVVYLLDRSGQFKELSRKQFEI